ncbi:hypothetical protein [Salibaculum halophilum]|uniref:hypothetical protein n=1 Tax=Salibaculum halophilum TaxID=1914408 RepID=UPI000A1110F3|nr:hypothetical protein [Salibaculum halophilum]
MERDVTLTKLRLIEGVWHGVLTRGKHDTRQPDLVVTHLDHEIKGVEVEHDRVEECWYVRVPIPADRIADGVQTFLVRDRQEDSVLASFAIVAGDALAEDIRAEIGLLRAELDMLKKAFRRHCVETAGD